LSRLLRLGDERHGEHGPQASDEGAAVHPVRLMVAGCYRRSSEASKAQPHPVSSVIAVENTCAFYLFVGPGHAARRRYS